MECDSAHEVRLYFVEQNLVQLDLAAFLVCLCFADPQAFTLRATSLE